MKDYAWSFFFFDVFISIVQTRQENREEVRFHSIVNTKINFENNRKKKKGLQIY